MSSSSLRNITGGSTDVSAVKRVGGGDDQQADLVTVTAGVVSPVRGRVQRGIDADATAAPATRWGSQRLLPMRPVGDGDAAGKRSPPSVPTRGSSLRTMQQLAEKHRMKMARRTGLTAINRLESSSSAVTDDSSRPASSSDCYSSAPEWPTDDSGNDSDAFTSSTSLEWVPSGTCPTPGDTGGGCGHGTGAAQAWCGRGEGA
ncbi:PREDICTED: uncharacterized protein LOC106819544 [Priapulus caudatus]|uniref:Uncharacterized protein LOC106819544 n=1 Tax=Priapulus caudatus TaxID=37621 RepID=A0ABM1F5C7_PRICU|nr:PREDICTED: uncharacterized protein LOC106819544 [Priapulus caudatus]